jgi:hypothetical protein
MGQAGLGEFVLLLDSVLLIEFVVLHSSWRQMGQAGYGIDH